MKNEQAEKGSKYIGSIIKAAEVLEHIARAEDGLGATDLSQELGYGVSAVYNILNTLRHCNLLSQDQKTKKYVIGYGFFSIAEAAKRQKQLESLAKPYLDRLMAEVQETSNLSVLEGINSLCVAQTEGPHIVRMFTRVGQSSPFYFSAGGKALVAFRPHKDWETFIRQVKFVQYTENTITSSEQLLHELELTRRRGYGIDNEERETGLICIGVPVFGNTGQVVAAMSVSGPAIRLKGKIDEVAQAIMRLAGELSRKLGYSL